MINIACHAKQKFKTWSKANTALKSTKRSQLNCHDKRKIAIYTCRTCGYWHIGGSDQRD